MVLHRLHVNIALVVLLIVFGASCAKRPVTAAVSAPAPTGIAAPPAPQPRAPEAAPAAPPAPAPTAPPAAAAPSRPAPREFVAVRELGDIYFDFDRYAIRRDAVATLQVSVDWLKTNASAVVLIEGHCDERGTNAYNLALGDRRARAARDYLVTRGVAADRITIISYGEERPVCTAQTEACWARNRRAHFLVKTQ